MPDLGQVPENRAQPSIKQRCHVLQQRESRSNQANGTHHLPPQSRAGPGKSGTLTGDANVLAWKACADDIRIRELRFSDIA
jgi:hypothetical protein